MNADAKPRPSTLARSARTQNQAGEVRPLLKAERIQEALRQFPGWEVCPTGPGLVRHYVFPSVRDCGAFAAFASSLLAELDALPELEIVGSTAAVRVASREGVGEVTALDFERVALLEGRKGDRR